MSDPLIDKAIALRTQLHLIESQDNLLYDEIKFSEKALMASLEKACHICVDMGIYFLKQRNWTSSDETHAVFDTLVQKRIIDKSLSRRLLSLISYGKMLTHATQLKGRHFYVRLRPRQIKDLHTFTQNLLLS